MAIPFLVIDGYNLLHAAGLARVRYAPGDLERVRHRFLAMLCERMPAAQRQRCTVVFDAQDAPLNLPRESRLHDVRILFAPAGCDADTEIETLIATHPAPGNLVVVSGDHRLHKAAKRRGATPIDSDPYWEQLERRPLAFEPPPEPPKRPQPRDNETAAWLAEFGPISIEDLAAEVDVDPAAVQADPWGKHLADLDRMLTDPGARDAFLNDPRERKRPS